MERLCLTYSRIRELRELTADAEEDRRDNYQIEITNRKHNGNRNETDHRTAIRNRAGKCRDRRAAETYVG